MPPSPKRICVQAGCHALVEGGSRCPKHQVREGQFADPRRGTSTERGYGATWRALRDDIMIRDHYVCQPCLKADRITVATQVDHVIPKEEGGSDDPGNLQSICKACHQMKTQIEAARGAARAGKPVAADNYPEWLEPAACDLRIVFGPPGAGKSRYVQQYLKLGDQVIDIDSIMCELSGKPIYHSPEHWIDHAVRVRNARLANLKRGRPVDRVWFVTYGTGVQRRDWWIRKLAPTTTYVQAPPLAVCIENIQADGRRPPEVKMRQISAARDWWQAEAI